MTTVTGSLRLPDGRAALGRVRFELVDRTTRRPLDRAAFDGQGRAIVGRTDVELDQDGRWEVDLPGQSSIDPPGTAWARIHIDENGQPGRPVLLVVPAAGGPVSEHEIMLRDDEPSPPAPAGAAVVEHAWERHGWDGWDEVTITEHGSQVVDRSIDGARGVVTGPGPEGALRVALLRRGTEWRDGEVRSIIHGPTPGTWTGNNAQQGHLHRVRPIGDGWWEGIAVWTSVVFGRGYEYLHVASVRWDGTTLLQSSNDGGAGDRDVAWIDRRLQLVTKDRIDFAGFPITRLGVVPSHGYGLAAGTLVAVDADDDTFDTASVEVQGFDAPAGFVQAIYGPTPVTPVSLTTARGHVTPAGAHSQRRWCPFGLATRVVGGDDQAVTVEIKRWRAGWDPEPGWDDPRVMRATVTPDGGGNVPEMALGPGLHGLWVAHLHGGSSAAFGPVTFHQLD